jgi:CRISPR-associated exonuclease Cas4
MVISIFSVGIAFVLLALIVWLFKQSNTMRQRTGVPQGNIIYTDTGTWFPNVEPLYAQDVRLVGKPDYLVEQPDGNIIPVEVKSGRAPSEPWEGHIFQLAAYCLLVEEQYGVRPEFGIIQYKDKAFAVDYTEELEDNLLDLIAEMRQDRFELDLERDHNDWQLCVGCGMNHVCDQRLA